MPWGLIVICVTVFCIFFAIHCRTRTSRPCPKGCHGCGRCMSSRKTNPEKN